ncbi:uncharacterized protein EV420DRAFT_590324 [Desarmillaria tabescens]|uniref:Uncharacterized protein n=1 Tax=Armillaria tabescens TaxID=1929756 RepID=A0AA39KAK9_ARMTA|nr:uncharacterized protein EV420DRAFT_590324 [Desarmillaria tabescens]KAK0455248.1 hypothetical protein EV420DRAFT_590324 [Desarmillaria tabescens]
MNPTSSFKDPRHSISFLLSRPDSPSTQEGKPSRSTSSLSWTSTATAIEDVLSPFLSSRSTTVEPSSQMAWYDKDVFALPLPDSGVLTPRTRWLSPPTISGPSDVRGHSRPITPLKPAPQQRSKGKARATLTPLLTRRHGGHFLCQPCLPDSILRSHEPWWALQPDNPWDVTYVNYESALTTYGAYMLQRIELIPTRPNTQVPGISILNILQEDDAILDGDKAIDIDSAVVELRYKGRKEKVQLRCCHSSITTHGLAYLMSTHIYHHLEAQSNAPSNLYSIGNVLNARLVSIYSMEPGIWVPEIAFVL